MHSRTLGLLAVLFVGGWAMSQTPAPVSNPALPPTTVAPPGVPAVPGGGPTYPAVGNFGTAPTGPAVIPAGAGVADAGGAVYYGGADYLLWKVQNSVIPQTATTLPVGVVAINYTDRYFDANGNLVRIVPITGYVDSSLQNAATFGFGTSTDTGAQSGSRVTFGFWSDPDMSFGLEGTFLFLAQEGDQFRGIASVSNDQFIINTGFTPTDFQQNEDGSFSPQATYSALAVRQLSASLVGTASTALWGGEINARSCSFRVGGMDVIPLAGFRYLAFKDELSIINTANLTRPAGIQRTASEETISLSENFSLQSQDRTRIWNHFFGGQVGVDLDWRFGDCALLTRLKIAAGNMHKVADVNSFTSLTNNEPTRLDPNTGALRQTSPTSFASTGGLLAAPGENGRHTRENFAFIPEINVKLGYQFNDWLRGFAGYDFLWIYNVSRAGYSVASSNLNTTVQIGQTLENIAVTAPSFRFQNSDIWIQGISFGLEARY